MKTGNKELYNNDEIMSKRYLCWFIVLIGGLLVSCDSDKVDELKFDVTVRNNLQEVYVGDEVIFDFGGNPDYIVFYSGENGKKYANKDRLNVEVESMSLSYTIKQQYTNAAYQNRETMQICISTDFNGVYTAEAIEKATWTKISGTEDGRFMVPVCSGKSSETVLDEGDLSAYKDKKFYLAFRYQTPAVLDLEYNQPRVDVEPLALMKKVDGGTVVMNNPSKEFGFNYVFVKGNSQNNFSANDSRLLFQPQNTWKVEVDVWAISQQLDVTAVSPDQGEPIKSLDMKSPSYSYRYNTPGEYIVTFVALNANMWNSESMVREMKIIVKEK